MGNHVNNDSQFTQSIQMPVSFRDFHTGTSNYPSMTLLLISTQKVNHYSVKHILYILLKILWVQFVFEWNLKKQYVPLKESNVSRDNDWGLPTGSENHQSVDSRDYRQKQEEKEALNAS